MAPPFESDRRYIGGVLLPLSEGSDRFTLFGCVTAPTDPAFAETVSEFVALSGRAGALLPGEITQHLRGYCSGSIGHQPESWWLALLFLLNNACACSSDGRYLDELSLSRPLTDSIDAIDILGLETDKPAIPFGESKEQPNREEPNRAEHGCDDTKPVWDEQPAVTQTAAPIDTLSNSELEEDGQSDASLPAVKGLRLLVVAMVVNDDGCGGDLDSDAAKHTRKRWQNLRTRKLPDKLGTAADGASALYSLSAILDFVKEVEGLDEAAISAVGKRLRHKLEGVTSVRPKQSNA